MVDITEQISYWQNSSQEDFEVAKQLIDSNKIRHGLFFAHLALEKLLKAHVCKKKQEIAPRIHNLVRLTEAAKLAVSEDTLDLLAEMNEFNLEGRYPIPFIAPVSQSEAREYIKKTGTVLLWLTQQL